MNLDGYSDILIGCVPYKTTSSYTTQYSFVVYGRGSAGLTDITLSGLTAAQGFKITGGGVVVSSASDLNRDGYADVLVGSNYAMIGAGFAVLIPTQISARRDAQGCGEKSLDHRRCTGLAFCIVQATRTLHTAHHTRVRAWRRDC